MSVNDAESSAISRGCFASKGKRKHLKIENYLDFDDDEEASPHKRPSSPPPPSSPSNPLFPSAEDFAKGKWLQSRFESLTSLLRRLATDGEAKLRNELHQKLFAAVCDFVVGQARATRGAIPTGAMVLGVNMPDHQLAMKTLTEMIQSSITPHIARLHSNTCTNTRTTMVDFVSQLIPDDESDASQNSTLDSSLDDDEGGGGGGGGGGAAGQKRKKSTLCTMPVLSAWYLESVKERLPIVVIFEDFEGFDASVLERFIISCSGHHGEDDIPFIFLFSIATSVTTVHHLLSHSVSSLLAIQTFQSPLAVDYLSSLIDQTLLSPDFHFKLGPKIFAFLREVFHYHDFSVANFIASLQVCLMEHFLGNPISYLCCQRSDIVKRTQNLSKADLELFRHLPSFKDHLSTSSPSSQSDLVKDAPFRMFLQTSLLFLDAHHLKFLTAVRLLFAVGSDLPKRPLGQRLHALYERHLKTAAKDCSVYGHVMAILRVLGKEELTSKLEAAIEEVSKCDAKGKSIEDLVTSLLALLQRLVEVDRLEDESEGESHVEGSSASTTSSPSTTSSLSSKGAPPKKGLKLHELQASLHTRILAKTPSLSKFEQLRKDVVDTLDDFFSTAIVPPKHAVFHEVVYFDRHQHLRAILNPAPRASISKALAQPHLYLDCPCCLVGVADKDRILASYPDAAIAYKLHLECPRYINLYDWLQAFIQVVRADGEADKEAAVGDAKKPDPLLQARFISAVAELQFLGFIGPTSKKTDHVIRLTWGSG